MHSPDKEFDVGVPSLDYHSSVVLCLCFAIDDRESFWNILEWNKEAKRYAPYAKFFVIGCKMDNRIGDGTVRHCVNCVNSRRVASPLKQLVEGQERWEAPDHPQGVLHQNWVGIEQNSTVI
ncbi:hypothetical protein TNCV_2325721 [Trichonephila clavipes]|nr:hypothetical protein TNCV_2325721 [Trichonephila clavipes]